LDGGGIVQSLHQVITVGLRGDGHAARLQARSVSSRGAADDGGGGAPALFALAETYDPTTLAAWGTFGTQGDVAKARELYAKAFASGVQEAGDRLNALRE
jgi:hypothetical protein